jgi:glycerol-1-phosphate dehydrogenase [NAD(P)+]
MSHADFAKAIAHAPETRPGRYTILERLAMSEAEIADRVEEYVRAIAG